MPFGPIPILITHNIGCIWVQDLVLKRDSHYVLLSILLSLSCFICVCSSDCLVEVNCGSDLHFPRASHYGAIGCQNEEAGGDNDICSQ